MNKKLYKNLFEGKKITIMGLGILGRGLQVTQFLAQNGALLTVTDLKTKENLKTSLDKLKKYPITYHLGKHDLSDFEHADIIVKAPGVPQNSPYIQHAKEHNIPIVMDASLFARIIRDQYPSVQIIGITGTRGKSMTTALVYYILKSNEKTLGCKIHLGGNMRMKATLPLLKNILPHDIVVLELDSWQCQGFGDEKISPHIAVFTTFMPDHMNYYNNNMKSYFEDKYNICKFQTANDILITNKEIKKMIPKSLKSTVIIPATQKVSNIPMNIFGDHNLVNASYAYTVAEQFKLSEKQIIKAISTFPGLEGRLQYLKKVKGIHIINDNNATTPEATTAGITAVKEKYKKSNIMLIMGGSDKKLDLKKLVDTIEKNCKNVILLPGTGTDVFKKTLRTQYIESGTLKEAMKVAFLRAQKNDVILFSPGFASFGLFKHEYDRNDQFVNIIKKWK